MPRNTPVRRFAVLGRQALGIDPRKCRIAPSEHDFSFHRASRHLDRQGHIPERERPARGGDDSRMALSVKGPGNENRQTFCCRADMESKLARTGKGPVGAGKLNDSQG